MSRHGITSVASGDQVTAVTIESTVNVWRRVVPGNSVVLKLRHVAVALPPLMPVRIRTAAGDLPIAEMLVEEVGGDGVPTLILVPAQDAVE
jgi:hypothetical protein